MSLPDGIDPARTAFFLDFDGTLCEIVGEPEEVQLQLRTRWALETLSSASDGALAIISGRSLGNLDTHLTPLSLPAAGSHGAEIRFAPGEPAEATVDRSPLEAVEPAVSEFAERHGLLLERKAGALTLHYRSKPELEEEATSLMAERAEGRDRLRLVKGDMVAELTLPDIDKGRALARFMERPPFQGRTPLSVGDDTTDEDAFRAARDLGGMAIRVGRGSTRADYRARNTHAFLDWLNELAVRVEEEISQ